jgi:hypothetical protein
MSASGDDLRPVKFRYIKPDEQGQKPVQFGLIAEEVAEVLPEVVYRNAEGKVEGVRCDELTPTLLNEVKQQREQLQDLKRQLAEIDSLKRQYAEIQACEIDAPRRIIQRDNSLQIFLGGNGR